MKEMRLHERIDSALEIRIIWPEKVTKVSTTINFSDGGALMQNPYDEIPAKGTRMALQLTSLVMGKEAPVLKVKVLRANRSEIAYQFLEET